MNMAFYTYLNQNGDFIEYLDSDSKVSFPYLERNAEWVGILRKMYPKKLTNVHEKEIFDFMYKSDKKKLDISKEQFYNLILKKINNLYFNPKEPLNLKEVINTNTVTKDATTKLKSYEKDISDFEKEQQNKTDLIVQASLTNKKELIKKFKEDIINLTEKIIDTKIKMETLKNSIKKVETQTPKDLFSKSLKIIIRTSVLLKSLIRHKDLIAQHEEQTKEVDEETAQKEFFEKHGINEDFEKPMEIFSTGEINSIKKFNEIYKQTKDFKRALQESNMSMTTFDKLKFKVKVR